MNQAFIQYERIGRVGYLTLNRPEKRNALHEGMVRELTGVLEDAEKDHQIKVIVLRAAGRVFSAGADLAYLERLTQNTQQENQEDSARLMALYQAVYRHSKLVIGQVEGDAIAGGCGLATVCDLCYAVPEARFGYTETHIGFIPALVSVFLISKIGEGRARELLLTGKLITAEEATLMGLITGVRPGEEIAGWVRSEAETLCERLSSSSVALTKKLMADLKGLSLDTALREAAAANARARSTADCQKGIRAFLEKRKIKW